LGAINIYNKTKVENLAALFLHPQHHPAGMVLSVLDGANHLQTITGFPKQEIRAKQPEA
jgi:hypothetical protein